MTAPLPPPRRWRHRLAWLAGLWLAGVLALSAVALLVRIALSLAGLHR